MEKGRLFAQASRLHCLVASAALIGLPASALAQAAPAPDARAAQVADDRITQTAPSDLDEVVVSGSRIARDGFQQPTPVTVVGSEEIQRAMRATVADYLNTLPSFGTPTSSANPGIGVSGAGTSLLNLRNLGSGRTLVMLDNRRVVASSNGGGVDVNTLPMTLVSRVEVVTGGASAAWGADAVAGVVNFMLNHNYEGLGVNAQYSLSQEGDNENDKIDVTIGRAFAGGRARFVGAATYSRSPQIVRVSSRDWWKDWAVVPNPAFTAINGQPRRITVAGAAPFELSTGGVIVSGPLRGTQFIGPNGNTIPYNFGNPAGVLQWGGDESNATSQMRNLTNALTYKSLFGHGRYELSEAITLFSEASYGNSVVHTDSLFYSRNGNLTITANNAFLNPTVRQQLLAANQPSFRMGALVANGPPPGSRNERTAHREVVGAEGRFGSDWKWNAYYQRGDVKVHTQTFNNPLISRFNQAVDAVRDPATGAIVCRSTLTSPTNGCVPYNIFGQGAVSAQAQDWVFGTIPFQKTKLTQDVVSADISGSVFSLPAGRVSVAFGADYYKDTADARSDAESNARNYFTGNFQPFSGEVSVREAFAETAVPIFRDVPFAKYAEVNAAVRLTDYSTSGTVKTWKLGVSYEINDDLRLRVTRSRDIRAPTLANLFTRGQTGTQAVLDPTVNRTFIVLANTRGNPELRPEKADTWTGGIVYRPSWLPGVGMSVDYYRIRVKGAISSISSQQTVLQCVAGNTSLCNLIIRDASGVITQIDIVPTNINLLATSGVDSEINYRREIGPGSLTLRALGSYLGQYDETAANGNRRKLAGGIGDFVSSQPKFKGNLSATYDQDPFSISARVRIIGKAKLDTTWRSGVDVDDNSIPSIGYLDLQGSYTLPTGLAEHAELSFAIDNVLNTEPPRVSAVPNTTAYQVVAPSTRLDLYDGIGRSFRVGLRLKF